MKMSWRPKAKITKSPILHFVTPKHSETFIFFYCYLVKSITMSASWLITSVKVRGVTSLQTFRASFKTRLTLSSLICHGKRWILNTERNWHAQSLSTKTCDHFCSCINTLCYKPPAFHCWTTNRHKPTSETTSDSSLLFITIGICLVSMSHDLIMCSDWLFYEHNETVFVVVLFEKLYNPVLWQEQNSTGIM